MCSLLDLPADLLPLLCEFLDSQGLKSLRLVSKIFNEDARRALFSSILLYPNTESHRRLDSVSQHVSAYVKSLTYCSSMVYFHPDMYSSYDEWRARVVRPQNQVPRHIREWLQANTPESSVDASNTNQLRRLVDNIASHQAFIRYKHHCDTQRDLIAGEVETDSLAVALPRLQNLEEVIFEPNRESLQDDPVMLETYVRRSGSCSGLRHIKQGLRMIKVLRKLCTRKPFTFKWCQLEPWSLSNPSLVREGQDNNGIAANSLKVVMLQINDDSPRIPATRGSDNPNVMHGRDILLYHLDQAEELHISGDPHYTALRMHYDAWCDMERWPGPIFLHYSGWQALRRLHLQGICGSYMEITKALTQNLPSIEELTLERMALVSKKKEDAHLSWIDLFHNLHECLFLKHLSLRGPFMTQALGIASVWNAAGDLMAKLAHLSVRQMIEDFVTHKGLDPFERVSGSGRADWQSPVDKTWTPIHAPFGPFPTDADSPSGSSDEDMDDDLEGTSDGDAETTGGVEGWW